MFFEFGLFQQPLQIQGFGEWMLLACLSSQKTQGHLIEIGGQATKLRVVVGFFGVQFLPHFLPFQFGEGSNQNSGNWIESLAIGTSGKYRYINVSQLGDK